jgi:hypothetical protein
VFYLIVRRDSVWDLFLFYDNLVVTWLRLAKSGTRVAPDKNKNPVDADSTGIFFGGAGGT